ncbi:probable serine/threonine-protein kinase yakA [Daktulosphaira vitifoliae]|uniref:probable serine/threonine-protein kinase yakA n=1 Tax=Daktulosphaira vitifoliae TaxID=58002 RepID=UPI0021A987FA|nr:probable serine/threonine-protein kinase yakA [Daktulosphaira vitifoliae]
MENFAKILVLVVTINLTLSVQPPLSYGPPSSYKYRPSTGGSPIPAKYPGGPFGKNEFYSKFNPHSLPPGFRPGPPSQSHFSKYPPPPNKSLYPALNKLPSFPPNFRLGPQFQSKPLYQAPEGPQRYPPRPSTKIVNNYGPKPTSSILEFQQRFPVALTASSSSVNAASAPYSVPAIHSASAVHSAPAPLPPASISERPHRGSYIINSDSENGPIKTIPAPNLNPADKPADFEEQLYKAQHPQKVQYLQPLDNSIIDDNKQSYQVTEDPSSYKPNQQSYFAPDPDTVPPQKIPPTTDPNSIPSTKVPLDVALLQHLEKQHHLTAEQSNALSPQELYTLLNGNPNTVLQQQETYAAPQQVVYAVPQQQLDLQSQLLYQQPTVQYAQNAVPIQYQTLQPVQMHFQQLPAVELQQYQVQQPYTSLEQQAGIAYNNQQQTQEQYLGQIEQYQEQQQQQQQQQQEQIQAQEDKGYEPRNPSVVQDSKGEEVAQNQQTFESIKDQYYSAVGNEQAAGVLAQIAESAANNNIESGHQQGKSLPDEADKKSSTDNVEVQKSIPIYEGSYSTRRNAQENANGGDDEVMAGSESVGSVMSVEHHSSSSSSSVNGHAPSQFPYNAANINNMNA